MIKQRKKKQRKRAKDTFRSFAVIMKLAFIRLLRAVSNTNRNSISCAANAHQILDTIVHCLRVSTAIIGIYILRTRIYA